MRPDLTKPELPGGRLFVQRLDSAAVTIQRRWRQYVERKAGNLSSHKEIKGLKMSDSVSTGARAISFSLAGSHILYCVI